MSLEYVFTNNERGSADGKITVKEADEQLPLPIPALRAMPYGVAML